MLARYKLVQEDDGAVRKFQRVVMGVRYVNVDLPKARHNSSSFWPA
jgi:hypothetical protein